MARRHHYRRRPKDATELDMTTFLNLMVVLVPFLLITAVFSRITIVELSVPTSAGGVAPTQESLRVEVIVREGGLELFDGRSMIASLPKLDGEYDLERLSEHVLELKQRHPEKQDASVLLEPDIAYDHLIQVMDAVRSTVVASADGEGFVRMALFTNIAIGDAP